MCYICGKSRNKIAHSQNCGYVKLIPVENRKVFETFQTISPDELIRVQPIREVQNTNIHAGIPEDLQSAQDGVLACTVTVIGKINLWHITLDQTGLFLGEGGPKRGDYAFDTILRERDDVHVSFHQNNMIKMSFLMKQICSIDT